MSDGAEPRATSVAGRRLLVGGAAVALVFALVPALAPWVLSGHSGALDLQRFEALHRAVAAGDGYPRWLPDLYSGYGSPMFNYYAPLPYAVGEIFRLLGAGALWAPKLAVAALFVVGALGARALARRCFGDEAGAVAFGLWATAPYLLLDLYVRSALGEIAGLALLPWAFATLLELGDARDSGALARAAAAFALLVVSHNIVALLAAPALGLVALASGDARARRARLGALAAGLALSAFFWVPALGEKHLVWAEESLTEGRFDVARNLLGPGALLPWRAQMSILAPEEGRVALWLGIPLWLGLAASIWSGSRLPREARRALVVCAAAFLLSLLMTTTLARPLWTVLPLARFVQFPFRWLGPASLAGVLLAAAAVGAAPARRRPALGLGLLLLAGVSAWPPLGLARYSFVEKGTLDVRRVTRAEAPRAASDPALADPTEIAGDLLERRAPLTATVADDFLPRTVTRKPAPGPDAAVLPPAPEAGVRVVAQRRLGTRLSAEVEVARATTLVFHQFWFPGWRAEVDGESRPLAPEAESGRLALALRPGDRRVELRFGATPLRSVSGLTSAFAALALAAGVVARRRWNALLPSGARDAPPR